LKSDTAIHVGYVGSEILAKINKELNPSSNMEVIREFWEAAADVIIPDKEAYHF
jgi:hypothetical protein